MTREERNRLKGKEERLRRVVKFFNSEEFNRFNIAIINDPRQIYASVDIDDVYTQELIMNLLLEYGNKLNRRLNP